MRSAKRISLIAKAAVTAAFVAGATVAVAPTASATNGNTVFNCLGQYFNTSWQQTCKSGGAGKTGNYHSIATCTLETDKDLTFYRRKGENFTYAGKDCTFNISSVVTEYY
ncbi:MULTISPECIES: hypothetical protein [unclassified Streptomyces]|uniref:hypothetical protein n=1 Tax=unclassified Streptomyces TaxID=2593676 RepID=UPI0007EC4DAB|nr:MULTISPECIES: hypothetical protein [unclassified Streptomyces]MCP3771581.1 hypothetical protein [Streptomyces sp. MAR25Y5]OBQ52334.1 hypothetical protein A4U61_07725 [Streptomyces sp. H-KF8]